MKLTPIMRGLALAGVLTTFAIPSWAEVAPKEAAPQPNKPMMHCTISSPSQITPILPTRIKVS
ncbi:Uncharacterised protein [Serratia proteamaculans]|nr:Uncharacterised protein [Serratia proteamaculans]CAI1068082.1 Uncharacterised protein [Serratia proteamaculans]CAI2012933.1 Uncharacterised protein [Serratia proteamaculans]